MAIVETKMKYDYDDHRYILTIDTVRDKTGYDLVREYGDRVKANIKLDEFSRQVYNEMYTRLSNQSKKVLEYRIFDEDDSRNGVMWAMLEQVKYAITDSGNLTGDLTGLDPNTGQITDYKEMKKRLVSPLVQETLRRYDLHYQRYTYTISDDDYRNGY